MLFVMGLAAPAPAMGASPVTHCAPSTAIEGLILGESADIVAAGEYQGGVRYAAGREDSSNALQLDAAFGFEPRYQLQAEFDQERLIDGGIDNAVTAGIGYQWLCDPGAPNLRVDFGFHHDGGNGMDFGFVTGQGYTLFGWQFGVHHSTAIDSTRYNAAVILGERILPLVLESTGSDSDAGWDTANSFGIYPIKGSPIEIGLAYVSGGGLSEGERHLVVKVTGTF